MYKVSVIGAGFAGLASACVLAHRGCNVTVFEKNRTLGGRARTFEAEGFTFDMGPSWYWMPDVLDAFFNIFRKQVSDYYDLRQVIPSFRIFFGDKDLVDVPASMDELCDLFESIEPGSGPRLRKFLGEAAYKYEVGMRDLVFKPGESVFEFADWRFLRGMLKMHVFQSFHSHVRKYFQDPKLLRIMEFPVLFLGGMPRNTPALYSLMNYAGLCLGTWYPVGGMGKLVGAMTDLAKSLGVTFKTGTEITRIAIEKGMAAGIHSNGTVEATEAVVAGADYHHVEQTLLPSASRNYDQKYWDTKVMAPSSLIFYLGVNRKLRNLQHHNLFFDEDFDRHVREIYQHPDWPTKPLFYVCCPSKSDSSVAPEGCENLFILIPIAAGLQDSEPMREKYFDLVIRRLQRLTNQEITPHIVFKRSYCLQDFKNDYYAFKGNAYGLANTLRQTAIFKPSVRSKKVKNLFFTGQLTVPGPGVPPSIISGQIAANQALAFLSNGR